MTTLPLGCPLTALFSLVVSFASANYASVSQRYTADLAPLVVGDRVYSDRVYIYTTHDLANYSRGWNMVDYTAFSSTDLLNWEDHGVVFSVADSTWAAEAWAQQVVQGDDNKFYLYFPNGA